MSDKKDFDWDAFRKEQKDREDAAKQERQRANDSVKRSNKLGKKK